MGEREAAGLGEERFVLHVGLHARAGVRADVLAFSARNGLRCEVSERRDGLLSAELTFRVRGPRNAIASLAGYLRWSAPD